MQSTLILQDHTESPESLALADARADFFPACYGPDQADALFSHLRDSIPWRQDRLNFGGRSIPVPRLQAWFGDADSHYGYSGLRLRPQPWTPALLPIKARVEALSGCEFNAVLLNYYRDGNDSVAWHSDSERELGPDPVVASLSLGATRRFELRRRDERPARRLNCELGHGSLLVMGPGVQRYWQHRIPKQTEISLPRINLTFRRIQPA